MKQIDSISTVRTKGRRMTPGDIDDLASMYQNAEVMKTLGGEKSREQAFEFLDKMIHHFDTYGFSYWIIEDKENGAFIGRAGLLHTMIDGSKEVELGYAFLPEYWGKGIATEVATEIVRIGFEQLGLDTIVSFSLPENSASQRVMEKVGFTFEKECIYKGLPHVLYRLTRQEWENKEE